MTAKKDTEVDPTTFDLDAWIDGEVRPERTVHLYKNEITYQIAVAQLEALTPAADDTERAVDDTTPTAQQIADQRAELDAERSRTALPVRIRQMLDDEIRDVIKVAREAGVEDPIMLDLWLIAESCVAPKFTPAQLDRLRLRDRSGEAQVLQILEAVNILNSGLPVPS